MPDKNNISNDTIVTITITPTNSNATSCLITVTHDNGHQCISMVNTPQGTLLKSNDELQLIAEHIVSDCQNH